MHAHDDTAGAALRKWVVLYNQFLFQVIALRALTRAKRNRGHIQDLLTRNLRELLEVTDQLNAFGWRPVEQFAGTEAALWAHAVRYACAIPWQVPPADLPLAVVADDAARVRAAWDRFAGFAAGLDAEVFGSIPALDPQFLRPDRLAHLVSRRNGIPDARADLPHRLTGEPADKVAVVIVPSSPAE